MIFCPSCKKPVRLPTEKEMTKSLSIHYAQTTHKCPHCGKLWVIHEQTVPLDQQQKKQPLTLKGFLK